MIDTRMFFLRKTLKDLAPESDSSIRYHALAMFHGQEFLKVHGEGWVPVSHSITVLPDGTVLVGIMANREFTMPGTAASGDAHTWRDDDDIAPTD